MIRLAVLGFSLCSLVACGGNTSNRGDDGGGDDGGGDDGGGNDDGGVDAAPVAVDDTATIPRDAGATLIDVLANDTDSDGGPMTIASTTSGEHGTVAVASDGLSLTYQPDAGYCSALPDTFTYTLAPGGDTATVTVTIECPWPGTTTFTANGDQYAWAAAVNANGDLFIAGSATQDYAGNFGAGQQDMLVMKVRRDGTREWAKLYGGPSTDEAMAIAVDADGSLVVFGHSSSDPFLTQDAVGGRDAIVMRLAANGDVLDVGRFGSNQSDDAASGGLTILPDGDLVVAGTTNGRMNGVLGIPSGTNGDGYIVRVAPDLDTIRWTTQYGTSSIDAATGVALLTDGTLAVSGLTHGLVFTANGPNSIDGLVAKLNATTGEILWGKQFGGGGSDYALGVVAGADGGFFVAGSTASATFATEETLGGFDYFAGFYDTDGDTVWMHRFGGDASDETNSVASDGAGGLLVGGYSFSAFDPASPGVGQDMFAARIDATGALLWQREVALAGEEGPGAVARAGSALYLAGHVPAPDIVFAKLTLDGTVITAP